MPNNKTMFAARAGEIMALLQNARKIAILRQDRRLAADAVRACSLYAKGMGFPCDHDLLENLAASIVDKNNYALIDAFDKVEREFALGIEGAMHKTWKTISLPR